MADYDYGSLDPKLYVPAILGPWVQGYFVHIAHIPALLWNQNRVYGLVWDAVVPTVGGVPVADYDFMAVWNAVVPTNEGVPMADYDFMAVWTKYCINQQYWVCGSKGYLGHITLIPPYL